MSKTYPLVALREVLAHNREYIEAPDPKLYPKLSVKLYGKGVVLDEPADGSVLKMKKHQLAKSGQIILSEIWGKKGAIGFVPPEGEGALCTSHFFLFDVRCDLLEPKYLQAIFTANYLFEFRLIGIALSTKDSGKGLAKYRCQVVRLKCETKKHYPIAA